MQVLWLNCVLQTHVPYNTLPTNQPTNHKYRIEEQTSTVARFLQHFLTLIYSFIYLFLINLLKTLVFWIALIKHPCPKKTI